MIRPNGKRILVHRLDQAKIESTMIIIPETIQEKPSVFATVLAIGPKVTEAIRVGDVVVVKDFAGTRVETTLPGDESVTECALVQEEDVLAVVEGV